MGAFSNIREAIAYKKNTAEKRDKKARLLDMTNEQQKVENQEVFNLMLLDSVTKNLAEDSTGYYLFRVEDKNVEFLTNAVKDPDLQDVIEIRQDETNPALAVASWAVVEIE